MNIVRGQRIHCILYGGNNGIVYNVRGWQAPGSVRSMGGVSFGGSALFDVVFDNGTLSSVECMECGEVLAERESNSGLYRSLLKVAKEVLS